ncbi:MAG: hypothetical protein IPO35_18625 [Uliginosibacterium sp.]|nr:hypothetical protein [Uliginosibacterium sp.]
MEIERLQAKWRAIDTKSYNSASWRATEDRHEAAARLDEISALRDASAAELEGCHRS